MSHIKSFKVFEKWNADEVDLDELEDIIIDFKQMGLDHEISFGTSVMVNFDKNNRFVGDEFIKASDLNLFSDGISKRSLSIGLFRSYDYNNTTCNINGFEESYNMISDYLKNEYGLIPNYIYFTGWPGKDKYIYFENVDMIRKWLSKNTGGSDYFTFNKLTLGYYKK